MSQPDKCRKTNYILTTNRQLRLTANSRKSQTLAINFVAICRIKIRHTGSASVSITEVTSRRTLLFGSDLGA